LIDVFAHFDDVNVLTQPPPPQDPAADGGSPKAPGVQGPAYKLDTTIERPGDGGVSATFRLVDATDGVVAWSKTFDNVPVADDRRASRYPIITEVATTLFHPFGVIQTRERGKLALGGEVDPRYACVLASNELWRSFDPARYAGVRGCLDRAIADDPAFAGGLALLARLYLRDFQFGYGGGPGDPAALDRALALAHRAIELKPDSARSHYILLEILAARGAVAEGLAEGEKALALNPFDLTAVFHYGAALVRSGNIEKGLEHLRRVDSGGVIPQQQLSFLLFVAAYLHGDDAAAARYAERITSDKYTHGFLARALAARKAGDQQGARQAFDRLVALQPAWRDDPRGEFRKYFSSPEIVERLAGDVTALSLGRAGAELTGSIAAPRKRD
jgi:tetratricopeptide (TPR) repeat protein